MSKVKKTAQVFHFDLYGKREFKYDFLNENSLNTLQWNELKPEAPNFFLVKKDFDQSGICEKGFKVDELFLISGMGITTGNDKEIIDFELKSLKFKFSNSNNLTKVYYRLFDTRYINYDTKLVERAREKLMSNLLGKENIGLISLKGVRNNLLSKFGITKLITDKSVISTLDNGYIFPLYLYPGTNSQQTIGQTHTSTSSVQGRIPNLNTKIVLQIAEKLGLTFTNEKTSPTPPMEGLSKPGYITANPLNYLLIKEMRDNLKNNPTEAEKVIWEFLRNKKTGYKIRRQHIIDDFITDFVCLSKKVVIEIDGKIHLQQKEYDELRTARLNELEYEVIRFTNEELFANPELVALKIKEKLDNKINLQSDNDAISPPSEESGEVLEVSGEVLEFFAPIDILDYIYAVLHSPTYREKYKEFLKIDFPRVPYPKTYKVFKDLIGLGSQLRQIHLLESPIVNKYITQYPIGGDNIVGKVHFENNRVHINYEKTSPLGIEGLQYFDNVPKIAWEFYIGGYQPAQKWLKDRKTRTLEFDDILHYQKIIVALTETHRLMQEIDKIEIE